MHHSNKVRDTKREEAVAKANTSVFHYLIPASATGTSVQLSSMRGADLCEVTTIYVMSTAVLGSNSLSELAEQISGCDNDDHSGYQLYHYLRARTTDEELLTLAKTLERPYMSYYALSNLIACAASDTVRESAMLLQLVNTAEYVNKYSETLSLGHAVLRTYDESHHLHQAALNMMGNACFSKRAYNDALDYYRRVHDITMTRGGRTPWYLIQMARVHCETGDREAAGRCLEQARTLLDSGNGMEQEIESLERRLAESH